MHLPFSVLSLNLWREDPKEFSIQMGKNFENSGFCGITEHSINKELIVEVLQIFKEFFALPEEEKMQYFEINLGRCILCGICVDVCNFDAIEMSHEHERSKFERNGNRVELPELIEMGTKYQQKTNWSPKQEKNRGTPKKPKDSPEK